MFVDDYLMQLVNQIAMRACKKFKLKYRKIYIFHDKDPEKEKCDGIFYPHSGRIYINLVKPGTCNYHKIEDIIDTTLHELAHLRVLRHNSKFWSFLKEMKDWFNAEYLQR